MPKSEKYIKNSYKELESALGDRELQQALTRKADQILREQIQEIVTSPFNDYSKLFLALKGPAEKNSKESVKFTEIENECLRERLEHTVDMFGASRVYDEAKNLYQKTIGGHVNAELKELLPKIHLKELKELLDNFSRGKNGEINFDYGRIKDNQYRNDFKDLVNEWGSEYVFVESLGLMNFVIGEKIKSMMWYHESHLKPLKGFEKVCADLKSRQKQSSDKKEFINDVG